MMRVQFLMKNFWLLLAIVVLPAGMMHAQQLDIDEIQVIAPYEPTISDAFKININPSIEDTVRIQLDFDYKIQPRKVITAFEVEPIVPARMRGEPLPGLYRGHVKGGYGSYQTPYFEAFYNTLRSNDYVLGVHVRHISSGKEIEDHPHSLFSRNRANIHGTRFFRNTALEADILYDRHVVHYYGFPYGRFVPDKQPVLFPITPPKASDIRQRYELISSRLGFGNPMGNPEGFRYHFELGHHWLSDRFNGNEHQFSFSGTLGSEIGPDPFGIADKQHIRVDIDAGYFYQDNPLNVFNTGIYSLSPVLESTIGSLQFHIGVNMSVEDDNGSYQMRTYPLTGLQVNIIDDKLMAYVDWSGGLEKQSWRALSESNPFMMPSPVSAFTNVRSKIGGGLRGSFGRQVSYALSLTSNKIDNHPFFVRVLAHDGIIIGSPAISWQYPFMVIYDNINLLHFNAEVLTRIGESFSVRLQGEVFDYTLNTQQEAWHKPGFLLSLNNRYSIRSKFILTADLYGRGKTYGGIYNSPLPLMTSSHKLHDFIVDANLGIEYRYTELLSVFLNFTNIMDETYEKWLYYPRQGFGFLGGISVTF